MPVSPHHRLTTLIDQAAALDPAAIRHLLAIRGDAQQQLFAAARAIRDAVHGRNAIVRGLIEVTNACTQSCQYCPMRTESGGKRYHLTEEALLTAARAIRRADIGVVFLQGGEAPGTTRTVGRMLPAIRAEFDRPPEILLCLGSKPRDELALLRAGGADAYILKQETSDPALHMAMRGSALAQRLQCARDLQALGFRIGLGTIVGLPGQTPDSLVADILLPAQMAAQMTSASPFVPAPHTPLANAVPGDMDLLLNVIALMRIVRPTALIPSVSALEQRFGPGGQVYGFHAGANVITVNFTPPERRAQYTIYGRDRFVVGLDHALSTLAAAGLEPRLGATSQPVDSHSRPARQQAASSAPAHPHAHP